MHSDSGHTTSVWMAADVPELPQLTGNTRTSVCIIGAGIAGMTTAYLLARAGRAVVLIDDGQIGGGETGRTTAHITAALDDRYYEIARLHGDDGARMAAESHTAAIQRIDGFLFLDRRTRRATLERELEAARAASLTDVALFERAPLDAFDTGPVL